MQDTNLKISPYFDDFDRAKNYQKVLFKPGYSVQTRELNSLQSMMQNQIERFGQHVFKEGSVVIPGNIGFRLDHRAVLIQPLINGISVEGYRRNLVGKVLTGSVSGVKAEVLDTISAEESEKDVITFYVRYISGGVIEDDVQVSLFKNNEVLIDENDEAVALTTVENASSYIASMAYLNAGVYFIRGFFVEVPTQSVLLDQYSNSPSYKVGLQITESIVSAEEDASLFDNALGTSNYASPGADRLQITATLVKQDLFITEDANFIELLRLQDGVLQKIVQNSIYNELEKNLARRTFDESGSYTKLPYTVRVREALNNGQNNGVYNVNNVLPDGRTILNQVIPSSPENSINGNDFYAIEVSQGKSYVRGFEVTNEKKQYVLAPKPRKTSSLNNQGLVLNIGSHFKLDRNSTIKGFVSFNDSLLLKDADDVTIGVAKVVGLTGLYRLYVTEVDIRPSLTLDATYSLEIGDFITGLTSGATGFIHSIAGAQLTIRQTTGNFIQGESITTSRKLTAAAPPKISSVSSSKLEHVRKVKTSSGFEASIDLDSVSITGSSFTVTGGTSLTGIGTQFLSEISEKSRLRLGDLESEVDTVTTTTVTLSTSISNGTYYNASKLVCRLYSSDYGLTTPVSSLPLATASDFQYSKLESKNSAYSVLGNQIQITVPTGNIIDSSSIVVTTGTEKLKFSTVQDSSNVVNLINILNDSNNQISDGTNVNVFYRVLVGNPTSRKKIRKTFKVLSVNNKVSNVNNSGTNESIVYGTRFADKEISLKFPDVIKIHAIHEALKETDTTAVLFDTVVVNDVANIDIGNIFTVGLSKAVVLDIVGNKLYIKYLSNSKIESGDNLAIPIEFVNNSSAIGVFIRESYYGRYRDVTNDFSLIRNDTSEFYKVSKLVRNSLGSEPSNKIIVVFDYFEHQNLTNDFYSVASYENTNYGDVPVTYTGNSPLNLVDFRIYSQPSSVGSTSGTIQSPYVETSTTSPFDYLNNSYNAAQSVPYPSGTFTLDYDHYLGRIDKVYLTIDGNAVVKSSSDSITPELVDDDSIGLMLATIKLPPYLKDVRDASISMEKNRGYTMKDIGKLEQRLSNVEKYASISLLESNTINMNILDEEGRNRFKNGFLVDSFTTTSVADLENPDYTASIDLDKNLVRPYPFVSNISFSYNETESTAKKIGSYLTVPYEEIPLITQPYASRVENLTPFIVGIFIGDMKITPKKDIWYDTVREFRPGETIDLTTPFSTLFDIAVPNAEVWGDWQNLSGERIGNMWVSTDIRTGVSYDIVNSSVEIETGDTIENVQDIRFARSRVLNIHVNGLKPNTKFYFYVNDRPYDEIVYPKLLRNLTESVGTFLIDEEVLITPIYDDNLLRIPALPLRAQVVNPNVYVVPDNTPPAGTYLAITRIRSFDDTELNPTDIGRKFRISGVTSGATAVSEGDLSIFSNSVGELDAFVLLPNSTFETGDITFSVNDSKDADTILGSETAYANGTYYAQGTELNVTATVVTVETPELAVTPLEEIRQTQRVDPLAQTFAVEEEGGVFVTSIDMYFYTKDDTAPVILDIRTVENGVPTSNRVPGAVSTVAAADIKTSTDASIPTKFAFDNPIYLSDKNEYCFVAFTTSKNYFAWIARLNESDITSGIIIDDQPAVGVLQKSANNSTWISDQFSDIKFTINRAKFTTNQTFNAVLSNNPVQYVNLINNPLSFTQNSSIIRVFHTNHGMHEDQNKVTFLNIGSETPNGYLSAALTGDSITSLVIKDIDGQNLAPSQIVGWNSINGDVVSQENPGFMRIDDEIISYTGFSGNSFTGITRGALSTTIVQHPINSIVECFNLNGILLSQLNTTHTITKVISLDEYEITVPFIAMSSKRSGGNSIKASRNIQYENIYPKFNSLVPSGTNADISIKTISGTSIGSEQQSFISLPAESINNFSENPLSSPRLVLSEPNRIEYTNNNSTLDALISLSTSTDKLSPVIDLDGSSIITISNRINREEVNGELDLSSELLPSGGKHSSYITKKVILENSSTSIKVMFDAIRQPINDIKVFVKIKGDSSFNSFKDMNYIEVPSVSYPISNTETEYRSFDYEIKGLQDFKEFSVKIVMIGKDQSKVPMIKNLRCLALAI